MDADNPIFWNHLYRSNDYAFGLKANQYLAEKLSGLSPGRILLPAEGEGRNAVHCARNGWDVYAFDLSEIGKQKSEALAEENGVTIDFRVGDALDITYPNKYFDVMALVFAHFVPVKRRAIHRRLNSYIREGGLLIMEGFARPSGVAPDLRYDTEEIKKDFDEFNFYELEVKNVNLDEGVMINGQAEVLRAYGRKVAI